MKSTIRLFATAALWSVSLLASQPRLAGQTTASYETLYGFTGSGMDGANPAGALVEDKSGNFYGTTEGGGTNGDGTVFKITPAGKVTTLHEFTGTGSDGTLPEAGLTLGSDGNFYGTTFAGGSSGDGTIFQMNPAGTVTTLHGFTGTGADGSQPYDGLVQGSDGKFYGTTFAGGENGEGTVFQFIPGGTFKTLHSFSAVTGINATNADGAHPHAGLIQGSDGDFYGTTAGGGDSGVGTIFKITSAGALTVLHEFTGANGEGFSPRGGLVEAGDGNFYGTGYIGGAEGYGTIFRLTPKGVLTTLHSFTRTGTEGSNPIQALVPGNDGNLYGATPTGSTELYGAVFQMTLAGVVTTLHVFTDNGTDGANPEAPLMLGNDGFLHGTTYQGGGSDNAGAVFKLSIPPTITSSTTAEAVVGKAFAYTITATNAPTSFNATGLPAGLSVDKIHGVISGTPASTTAGTKTLHLTATNAEGSDSATLTLTIVKGPPVITSAQTATAEQGKAFSYAITASNSPMSFAATGLPSGLSVNAKTGVISGETAATATGTKTITLKATNIAGTATATLTLTIVNIPVITSATTASATAGKAFSYQITAKYDPTSFNATGLPSGLSVNKTTGLISGTPASSSVGTKTLHLSANNSAGTGTQALTLTITKD